MRYTNYGICFVNIEEDTSKSSPTEGWVTQQQKGQQDHRKKMLKHKFPFRSMLPVVLIIVVTGNMLLCTCLPLPALPALWWCSEDLLLSFSSAHIIHLRSSVNVKNTSTVCHSVRCTFSLNGLRACYSAHLVCSFFLQLCNWKPIWGYRHKVRGRLYRSFTLHPWSADCRCNALKKVNFNRGGSTSLQSRLMNFMTKPGIRRDLNVHLVKKLCELVNRRL